MEKRSKYATPLGALIGRIVEPAAARKGMGVTSLLTQWPEIVGPRLAKICRPVELKWPTAPAKRVESAARAQSTLILRVDGPFALEAQHAATTILDRINAHLGWACVAKVAFRQGPIEKSEIAEPRRPSPGAAANAAAATRTADIREADLRDALTRLGARVLDRAGPPS